MVVFIIYIDFDVISVLVKKLFGFISIHQTLESILAGELMLDCGQIYQRINQSNPLHSTDPSDLNQVDVLEIFWKNKRKFSVKDDG